jgi:ATP-binding cassette, subfamily B, multidrug efflux pump
MSEPTPKKSGGIGSGFKEQKLGAGSDWGLMLRLWSYLKPYKATLFWSLLLLPMASAAELAQPYILKVLIDEHLVPRRYEGMSMLAGLFVAAILGRAVLQYTQLYLMQMASQRGLKDLRLAVFAHVQKLSIRFFHANPIGRLMTRMTTDVESLQEALASGMITMIGDIITLVAIVGILLWLDWRLALVSFLVVPPLLGLISLFRSLMRRAFRDIRTEIARLNAHLQESVTGMSVIQLFAREDVSAAEHAHINEGHRDANVRSVRYDALLFALVEAFGSVTVGAIIWYGSGQVVRDAVTIGVLVAFVEYIQKFFIPIRDMAQKYNLFQNAMASSERIFQLLDEEDILPEPAAPKTLSDKAPLIEFKDVWFAYKGEDWILKGVSFSVAPGEKMALVGHTGAGKSTILQLLLRLYDPQRGQILADGIDIRELASEQWRARFATVLQDNFLFRGSLRENLSMGREVIDLEQIRDACRTVRAEELILRYPEAYDHMVSERGQNLSAGERQLVSFARALLHKPQILILDEATANVDLETEGRIQEALDVLLTKQTSVVVAHRLSTIRRADRILVLHRGEILEDGPHAALMAERGHYYRLVRFQFGLDDDEQAA